MKEKNYSLKLKPVDKSDYRFLFKNLKERKPIVNISHRKMPTYNEHVKFVLSKPYKKWYIILDRNKKIGSVYLTKDNEIAMHFCKGILDTRIYQITYDLITEKNPRHRYFVNISPKNSKIINLYKKNGFTLRQVTYAVDHYFLD
jgi:hypothetical protein